MSGYASFMSYSPVTETAKRQYQSTHHMTDINTKPQTIIPLLSGPLYTRLLLKQKTSCLTLKLHITTTSI
jgi:hypothetical protein